MSGKAPKGCSPLWHQRALLREGARWRIRLFLRAGLLKKKSNQLQTVSPTQVIIKDSRKNEALMGGGRGTTAVQHVKKKLRRQEIGGTSRGSKRKQERSQAQWRRRTTQDGVQQKNTSGNGKRDYMSPTSTIDRQPIEEVQFKDRRITSLETPDIRRPVWGVSR